MIINILIIVHLLLDFTLQSETMAQKKKTNFKYLMIHSFIYLIGYIVICGLFLSSKYAFCVISILSISHFIVDWTRQRIELKFNSNTFKFISFIMDQVLHIAIIIAVSISFKLSINISYLYSIILSYKDIDSIILYIFLFVTIWDPTSVFIKKMFEFVLNSISSTNENDLCMGNLIGKLERVIVAILVLLNQYGVIGLVLTAKSIARFKQLEDKNFAEKYLVGTLASISFALIATTIVKIFI